MDLDPAPAAGNALSPPHVGSRSTARPSGHVPLAHGGALGGPCPAHLQETLHGHTLKLNRRKENQGAPWITSFFPGSLIWLQT